jgi:hypothetical protein
MLDPFTGSDLLNDIAAIMVPAIAALDMKGDSSDVGGAETAAQMFFSKFTKEKQREIINTLAKVTCVVSPSGAEPRLDTVFVVHFRGRLGAMYKWLFAALRVQFADFFDGMLPAIKAALAKVGVGASNSPSIFGSTLTSGD